MGYATYLLVALGFWQSYGFWDSLFWPEIVGRNIARKFKNWERDSD